MWNIDLIDPTSSGGKKNSGALQPSSGTSRIQEPKTIIQQSFKKKNKKASKNLNAPSG